VALQFSEFFHILNPNAAHRPLVKRFFERRGGVRLGWVDRKTHPTHLETIVEWALVEGATRLAFWGGDGTFSRGLQRLFELGALKDITVGFVPVGTGNDFCRRLGWSNWRDIPDTALAGKGEIRSYDLGAVSNGVSERVFLNNAGFGRSREALYRARPSALKDIRAFTEKALRVEWQTGEAHQFETLHAIMAGFYNGPYFNRGMHMASDIAPDDGLLDAFFVPRTSRPRLIAKLLRSRLGFPLADDKTRRLRGTSFHIESDGDLFPQVDGEPAFNRAVRRLNVKVLPGGLKLASPTISKTRSGQK
jgi:diacylglycerol kinase family enzyme